MKKIKIIVAIVLSIFTLQLISQTRTEQIIVPLSNPGSAGSLEVELVSGSLDITGYDGNDVIIEASMLEKEQKNKVTSSGLTRLQTNSFEIEAEEKNNKVEIVTNSWKNTINLKIKVPKNFSLKIGTVNKGSIEVKSINGEINASNVNGSITIVEVNGVVSASTVNGDILVDFIKITPNLPMAFSNMNGKIEVTFPANTKANLKMKNTRGDILTDFYVEMNKEPKVERESNAKGVYKVSISEWMYGKINGGGPEYMFSSFNGDIIIKKK